MIQRRFRKKKAKKNLQQMILNLVHERLAALDLDMEEESTNDVDETIVGRKNSTAALPGSLGELVNIQETKAYEKEQNLKLVESASAADQDKQKPKSRLSGVMGAMGMGGFGTRSSTRLARLRNSNPNSALILSKTFNLFTKLKPITDRIVSRLTALSYNL